MKLLTRTRDTTIGCDPEVFFLAPDNEVIPAVGLIGGNKYKPKPCKGGALQEDNVMAEFNTDPVTTLPEFLSKIEEVYSQLNSIATKHGLKIGIQASRMLSPFILDTYIEAKQFGCDPDFDAYTMRENVTPDPDSLLRTCAGHIHIGYDVDGGHSYETSAELTRYLDAYVGTYCVLTDKDTRRMSRYGKAGAFRPKPYGTEYRVPSNFWLLSQSLTSEIFNRVREGYKAARKGFTLPNDVMEAINSQNMGRCEEILCNLRR